MTVVDPIDMEEGKFYFLVVNCIDSADEFDGVYTYTVNACKAFASSDSDALELANEYIAMLEDELMETEEDSASPVNPYVYYGMRISSTQLPARENEYVRDYLVFIPNSDWETLTMLPCKGLADVASTVEKEMKYKQGLEIDDVFIFHHMAVELIKQIPMEFDQQATEMDFELDGE
jgi:hypothetical protein